MQDVFTKDTRTTKINVDSNGIVKDKIGTSGGNIVIRVQDSVINISVPPKSKMIPVNYL